MTTDTPPTSENADAPPPRRRRVMRRVRVTRVEQLSPRMVRVTFTGDDLGAFAWSGPAALDLRPHALAPIADLPVREIISAVHILADLTLGLGKVVHDYLEA